MSRRILITGSSTGIGKATTERLLEEGHAVWGIARRFQEKHHPHFHPYQLDLSQLNEIPKEVAQFNHVDALVCNVGRGHFAHLEELSFEDIRKMMELNFLSHVYLIKTLLPYLKLKERADIIFVGSEAALVGKQKGTIYCASKFALRGFAQSLREECARSSVHVAMIQPGMVRSSFYDALNFEPGREDSQAIEAEDVAEMIALILNMRTGTVCDEITLSPLKKVIQKKPVAAE